MPRYPGGTAACSDGGDRDCLKAESTIGSGEKGTKGETDERNAGRTRRTALAALGTASVGLTAGCLGTIKQFGGSRVPVDPTDPGDDPEATPGEFYFLLEENDITVADLYHDTDDNDLILFYESDATTATESDDEIAMIYRVFSEGLIDRGSDVNHLYTEVTDPFDGQVEGWAVNAQWAEEHLAGEASDVELWNAIARTKQYGDEAETESGTGANESETATDDGTAADGDTSDGTADGENSTDDTDTNTGETDPNESDSTAGSSNGNGSDE
ncbi:hypothetical protein [Natrialba asiatica]|uniref:DUF8159 domain-containing protein n=1 Tax=Natrialba asiatica (strain ATCC 700177 / DSM 12278 / JCM 9576 / FERM P-10747 / NBRC 102637 / 172P1) TaxID=29540 RepID=M0ALV4_NATA1|nr:hypothetical protein [Natrialba asiatica]ELY98897.1 hypothetical protein C481_16306 [Natrialba asiatica DSM 12278]